MGGVTQTFRHGTRHIGAVNIGDDNVDGIDFKIERTDRDSPVDKNFQIGGVAVGDGQPYPAATDGRPVNRADWRLVHTAPHP